MIIGLAVLAILVNISGCLSETPFSTLLALERTQSRSFIIQCSRMKNGHKEATIVCVPSVHTRVSNSDFVGFHFCAQGLPKECIIYGRVLRKYWISKRQLLYLWAMNMDVCKITHCPCMSLCFIPIALWHIFWNPKLFSNLHSAEFELLHWRENRPVRSQLLFKSNLSTVDSICLDWVYVLAWVPPEESKVWREISQKNLLFLVTVLPRAT